MTSRTKVLSRLWIALSVLYGACRVVAVSTWLKPYGVNPWSFAAIELSSSFCYGWSSSALVVAAIQRHHRRLSLLAFATFVSFAAPDAYVLLTVHDAPLRTMQIVVGVILIGALAGIVLFGSRLKSGRTTEPTAP